MKYILIHESFYADYEILKTNIPDEELDEFLRIYMNWQDRGIDFQEWLDEKGYSIEIMPDMDRDEVPEEYHFFCFDYLDEE